MISAQDLAQGQQCAALIRQPSFHGAHLVRDPDASGLQTRDMAGEVLSNSACCAAQISRRSRQFGCPGREQRLGLADLGIGSACGVRHQLCVGRDAVHHTARLSVQRLDQTTQFEAFLAEHPGQILGAPH